MTIKKNFLRFLFFYPGWWWWWGVRHVVLCVAYCYVGPAKMEFSFSPLVSLLFSVVHKFVSACRQRVSTRISCVIRHVWPKESISICQSIGSFFLLFFVNSNHFRLLKNDDISFYSLCVCVERRIDRNADFPHPLSSMRSVVMATSYNPLPLPPQHARYTHTHTHNV
jgi:hypothetical protein